MAKKKKRQKKVAKPKITQPKAPPEVKQPEVKQPETPTKPDLVKKEVKPETPPQSDKPLTEAREQTAAERVQKLNTKHLRTIRSGNLEDALSKATKFEEYRTAIAEAGKRAALIKEDHGDKDTAHQKIQDLIKQSEELLSEGGHKTIRDNVTLRVLRNLVKDKSGKSEAQIDIEAHEIFSKMTPQEKLSVEKEINIQTKKEVKELAHNLADLKGESVKGKLANFFGIKPKLDDAAKAVEQASTEIQKLDDKNQQLMKNCQAIEKNQKDLIESGFINEGMQGKNWLSNLRRKASKMRAYVLSKVGDDQEHYAEKLEHIKQYEKNIEALETNDDLLKQYAKKYDQAEVQYMDASAKYQKALDAQKKTKETISQRIDSLQTPPNTHLLQDFKKHVQQRKERKADVFANIDSIAQSLTTQTQTVRGEQRVSSPRVPGKGQKKGKDQRQV